MIKKVDHSKEPLQIAIKLANIVFILGILYSILLIVYAAYKIYNPSERGSLTFYIINILCCSMIALLFYLGLKRLGNTLKVILSVIFFIVGVVVYGFETYLDYLNKDNYNIYFGEDRFTNRNYYGGTYAQKKNDNNYKTGMTSVVTCGPNGFKNERSRTNIGTELSQLIPLADDIIVLRIRPGCLFARR